MSDTTVLVRQEIDLAKVEMAQKGKQASFAGAMFGGAGVVALLALGALTVCLIAALATGMQAWLAALIVAIVYAAVSGALVIAGRARVRKIATLVPEETIETVKEDVQWARTLKPSGMT
jgi:predicted lipid-binding transport protein (Tim44 family)